MRGLAGFAAGLGLVVVPAVAVYLNSTEAVAARVPLQQRVAIGVAAPSASPAPVVGTAPVSAPAPAAETRPEKLEAAVNRAMAGFAGRYSVVVQELPTGQKWVKNGTERYHPASTIKMPVALYALEQYRTGRLGWNDLITYTQADFESPGGGAFETSPFGGKYPVENLVVRALKYSNNVAVNMLGRHLGWNNVRAFTRTIDGELFRLPDGTPEVTPLSELGWWVHLDKLSRTDPQKAELLLAPLREVEYKGRIPAGLPTGVKSIHKFGSYEGYFHDGGIIFGAHPYALIVMTYGANVDEADAAIARVSSEIYGVMK